MPIGSWAKEAMKTVFGDDGDMVAQPYATAKNHKLIDNKPDADGSRIDWWEIYPEQWHQVFPYQFIIMEEGGEKPGGSTGLFGKVTKMAGKEIKSSDNPQTPLAMYTLPIPPQALSMRMVSASQVTPTIGGVVEETSANTFWDISLTGTTGTAVGKDGTVESQLAPSSEGGFGEAKTRGLLDTVKSWMSGNPPKTASKFRDIIKTTGEMSGIFGALSSITSKIGSTVDQVGKMGSGAGIMGNIAGASGALQNALLPTPNYTASAVNRTKNGFAEIQQLHRFLLVYSRLKGAFPGKYFLKFRMLKTNQSWNCSVSDFQISQNAQQPHLYRYSIQLKCWQIGNAASEDALTAQAADRFGPKGDLAPVNIISLKQASNFLKKTLGNI